MTPPTKKRAAAKKAAKTGARPDEGATTAPRAITAVGGLQSTLATLRGQVGSLRAQIESAEAAEAGPGKVGQIAEWTAARDTIRETLLGIDPVDLFAGLDATVPLVLLPVRLETRFADPGTDVLHVRIFPDDIHIDGHDPELTTTETALGTALWAAPIDLLADGEAPPAVPPATDSPDGRSARWAALVTLLGGPRAAWVAHATRPGSTPEGKPQAYIRPPVARALPDRWLVRAYVGGAVAGQAWTSPVGVDLHLAPDPQAVPDSGADGPGLPPVDPEMRWLIDYATAVASGMAVDVPLPAGTAAVDRVVAVGVRASTTAADGASELGALLTAHRYTDGLGFLAAGSPTSNSPDARSSGDRHVDPILLWQSEFGPAAGAGTAAARAASALGLPAGILDGSDGSGDAGDARAQAMQTATWASTWGYYLGQLLDSSTLGPAQIDAVRTHYLGFVRGRGTLPTLRIGRQPYGVLPILPLARWTADGASATVDGLARLLSRVRPLWQYGVGQPVTASEGPGFDAAFSTVMSTDAIARSYAIRSVIGDRTLDPLTFTGIDAKPGNGVFDSMIGTLLGLSSNPLILDIFSPTAQPVRAPLVVDPTDPTPDATVQAAIRGLAATNPQLVLTLPVWLKPRPQGPATLLHTMLRRSLLLEYANAGISLGNPLLVAQGSISVTRSEGLAHPESASAVSAAGLTGVDRDPIVTGTIATGPIKAGPIETGPIDTRPIETGPVDTGPILTGAGLALATAQLPAGMLVGLTPSPQGGFAPVSTMPGVLATAVPAITGSMATGEWLWRNATQFVNLRRTLDQTIAALDLLATLGAEELELLLPETLDLATHRWTAWAESIAADKLTRLRATTPAGVTLGGWGAVNQVARRARVSVDPALSAGASAGPLWEDVRPGGFVHAPSTAQAATAAVLRAAHLAHGGEEDPTCAIDLSSARARVATRLADGVRAGQALGALLGYELELDLHQRDADVLIAPLRAYAPQWKASGTFVEGAPEEIVSPSAVADGLALSVDDPAVVAAAVIPGGSPPALATSLAGALASLRDHQDSLADLLTAEAVHQALGGNTARASAALDAAHRGGLPPAEFDVLRTPRSGMSLTCRVAVLLPEPGGALAAGWPLSPRSAADPACADWLAAMLPAQSRVRLRIADAQGALSDAPLPGAASVGPLDVVLDQPEVLGTRLLLALPAGATLVHGRDPAWTADTVSLDELLTVAADLREVLAARPLRGSDLLASTVTPATTEERDAADLLARIQAAHAGLGAAATAVTDATTALQSIVTAINSGTSATDVGIPSAVAAARAALGTALAWGVVLQLPLDPQPEDLLAVLASASAELSRRLAVAAPAPDAPVDDLTAALKVLLGSGQPAVPRLLLDAALAAVTGPGLSAGDGYLARDPELASDWLDDVAGVRAGAGHLVAAVQDCEALAAPAALPDGWRILEPGGAGTAWTATLGAADLSALGPATTVVLRASTTAGLASGAHVCGLLVDEWVEVVPQPVAATSVAYQAEAPAARAPQAVLLGVAPDVAAGWDVETVVDLAIEALDLAGLRTVDAEKGAWLGRMLPAVLLPDGDSTDVIAAPPLALMQVDQAVLQGLRAMTKGLG